MSNYLLTKWQDATQELHEARREVEELRGRVDAVTRERDAYYAEIARLRAENERLKADQTDGNMDYLSLRDLADKAIMQREEWGLNNAQLRQDNIRLRTLLRGALVPCPECGGTCRICRRCHDPMRSPVRGYVPVEVEP